MLPSADLLGLDTDSVLFVVAVAVVGFLVVFRFLIPLVQGYRGGKPS
jgi:hypothetical protein